MRSTFLDLVRVAVVNKVEVDFNEVVVADEDPIKRVVDVGVVVSAIVVKAEVVLVVDGAFHIDDSDNGDTPPSLKMFLIGVCK